MATKKNMPEEKHLSFPPGTEKKDIEIVCQGDEYAGKDGIFTTSSSALIARVTLIHDRGLYALPPGLPPSRYAQLKANIIGKTWCTEKAEAAQVENDRYGDQLKKRAAEAAKKETAEA